VLRRLGQAAYFIDASIGWHMYALQPDRLQRSVEAAVASGHVADPAPLHTAIRALRTSPAPLRCAHTYRDRRVYSSAVNEFENALRAAAAPYPGVRLATAMIALQEPARLESSRVLEEFSHRPGPFDDYFAEELIDQLVRAEPAWVGLSVAFQQQMPAAVRLARMLSERRTGIVTVLGGPLVAAWTAAGIRLDRPPFDVFARVVAGTDEDLASLAGLGPGVEPRRGGPLGPLADEVPWHAYLSPEPILPAALARGCYWRQCTFCPEHLHPAREPCANDALGDWLRSVAAAFPGGAMLHLTDAALAPAQLARLARVISDEKLPLRWHGFARLEEPFADPGFARDLARGGCAMLQFGVETGSGRLWELLGKGAGAERAPRVLRACAGAGIRTHVYLLFGVPSETDHDREQTLQLVQQEAGSIHAVNAALLNLPKGSPMHRAPEQYGITRLVPFHPDTDLSLYDDFRCGQEHPRLQARRWLEKRFLRDAAVRAIQGRLRTSFKANHLCFL
jgi:hypothetical protein